MQTDTQHDYANFSTVSETSRRYNVSRGTLYAEIAAERLKAHKLGRLTIILQRDFDAWLAALPPFRPAA